jgi:2-methylcitrate dehydratase PrpD
MFARTGNGEIRMTGDITAALVEFTQAAPLTDVPDAVIDRAKIHILDTLGLALAGSVSDAARIVRDHLVSQGLTQSGSVIFATGLSAPPRFAAFANATAIHADNFDDTTPQVRADRTGGIHASGAVLPAVLAIGQAVDASGGDLIASYLVGVEVASRLNHTIDARHYGDGFHTTGTMNVFGAVCAVAHLSGLPAAQTVNAIGIAAGQASGVRRNFGAMAEILHPAQAAESAIVAVDLASRGLTAASDALDGPVGYFAAAAGGFDAAEIVGKLGTPWVFEDPGVWIKPHPNGALTHPGAGCLLDLMTKSDIAPERISGISVRTNERVLKTLIHHNPEDGMQAKFSMEFTLSIIALEGQAGLAEFTTDNLNRADVRAMMNKVDYTAYDDGEDGYTNVTTLIDITLNDGRVVSGRADHARGSTKSPMSFDDVAAKFRQCAAYCGHPADRVAAIEDSVVDLDRSKELTGILNALISKE